LRNPKLIMRPSLCLRSRPRRAAPAIRQIEVANPRTAVQTALLPALSETLPQLRRKAAEWKREHVGGRVSRPRFSFGGFVPVRSIASG
jgi:hypothetical protein